MSGPQQPEYTKRVSRIRLRSDEKTIYGSLMRKIFGRKSEHETFSSTLPRDTNNPLFPINLTNAMARDLNGRLRRRSWLASKQCRFLELQLDLFMIYRNYVRPRFNTDRETPGQLLGFLPRPATPQEMLNWRQDWGWHSIHPLANRLESIKEGRERERAKCS